MKPSSQCFHGTFFDALVSQDALGGVFAFTRILIRLYVHRADFQAFATLDAFALVAMDAQQGEVAHRLEEDRDGTDVFAKGAVVLERHGEGDTDRVIDQIADEEHHKEIVRGGFPEMEQQEDKSQRQCKHDVTDETYLLSRALRLFVRKEVKDHGRPAAIAAPTPTEKQWTEDLGDGIVQNARTHYAREQIIPKAFNLHVLLTNQSEENEHVGTPTPN